MIDREGRGKTCVIFVIDRVRNFLWKTLEGVFARVTGIESCMRYARVLIRLSLQSETEKTCVSDFFDNNEMDQIIVVCFIVAVLV